MERGGGDREVSAVRKWKDGGMKIGWSERREATVRDWREAVTEMGEGENERERCVCLTDRETFSSSDYICLHSHFHPNRRCMKNTRWSLAVNTWVWMAGIDEAKLRL